MLAVAAPLAFGAVVDLATALETETDGAAFANTSMLGKVLAKLGSTVAMTAPIKVARNTARAARAENLRVFKNDLENYVSP
jgi:hypothetical protein